MTTFNLGLPTKPATQVPINWAFEQVHTLTNELCSYFDTINNLLTIRKSLRKYGKTPQLIDLVGASFEDNGITFSNEGIMEAIAKAFKWIKDKLAELWKWFIGLFSSTKKIKENANKADKNINDKVDKAIAEGIPSIRVSIVDMPRVTQAVDEFVQLGQKFDQTETQLIAEGNPVLEVDKLRQVSDKYIQFMMDNTQGPKLLTSYSLKTLPIEDAKDLSKICKDLVFQLSDSMEVRESRLKMVKAGIATTETRLKKDQDHVGLQNTLEFFQITFKTVDMELKFVNTIIEMATRVQTTIDTELSKVKA